MSSVRWQSFEGFARSGGMRDATAVQHGEPMSWLCATAQLYMMHHTRRFLF